MPDHTHPPRTPDAPVVTLPDDLPGVELMHARYLRQSFPRHFHRRYGVGIIEQGAMAFNFLGRCNVAMAGAVNLTVPGEVHDGQAHTDAGWTYRMFYIDPEVVHRAAAQAADRPVPPPDFPSGVIDDPELAQVIRATHMLLLSPDAPLLARQSQLLSMLALWVSRHADGSRTSRRPGQEPRGVALARQYLEDNPGEDVALGDLAALAHLSQYHFLRTFTATVGIPPHAYLMGVRIRRARAMLSGPLRLADIAAETGFTDQAHFTHVFKRFTGVTPGRYRKFLQG